MENAIPGKETEENKTSCFNQPIQRDAEELENFLTPGVTRAPGDDKLIVNINALPEEIKKQLFSLLATSTPATVSKKEPTTSEEWSKGTPLIQPDFQVQQGAQGVHRDPAAQQDVTTGVIKQKVLGIQDSEATSSSEGSFGAQEVN